MNDPTTAFPLDTRRGYYLGMSLRDYFAGQALIAMGDRRWLEDEHETGTQKSALACYALADAMLAARGDQS